MNVTPRSVWNREVFWRKMPSEIYTRMLIITSFIRGTGTMGGMDQ